MLWLEDDLVYDKTPLANWIMGRDKNRNEAIK